MADDTARYGRARSAVPIEFIDLLDDDGWEPMPVDQTSPTYLWNDGGLLADAPVDMEATFNGAMWRQRKVDRSFNLDGLRCRPNFTVPDTTTTWTS